eukprot:GDKK01031438.1.p1 GENE.GDKK01031438.1~~GDKK01031438.1.p1  ORF type:complete len:225 (+),score=21.43 GDKK01031438.1:91-765(+)
MQIQDAERSRQKKNKLVRINPERWNADRVPDADDKFTVIFQKIDVSGDGVVEPRELLPFIVKLFRTRVTSERPRWTDHDIFECARAFCFEKGEISNHGFRQVLLPFVARSDRLDMCDMLIAIREFARTDSRGTGYISPEDAVETLARIFKRPQFFKSPQTAKFVRELSDRKDGQLNLPVFLRGFSSYGKEFYLGGGREETATFIAMAIRKSDESNPKENQKEAE